ncbi:hypothetical protein FRC17_007327, partial [Serendipita sp. 399]
MTNKPRPDCVTGMGFNYLAAGGAQHPNHIGWIYGGYTGRFASTAANYRTARQFNAQFILKMSDLWGADGTQGSNAPYPGDNGNWADYDKFLAQFVSDIKANGMTSNIKLLPWNEPDLTTFWNRREFQIVQCLEVDDADGASILAIGQYLDTWVRTVNYLRSNLAGVPIGGPSMAFQPSSGNTWWTSFMSRIKSSNTAPDVYTWHHETSITDPLNDLQSSQPNMVNLINSYGLPMREFILDEYGTYDEQNPSSSAWWIARLERYNMSGMRGNWLSRGQLHDFLASLLGKADVNNWAGTGYYSNGEWLVYNYYATQMTGYRVATTGSTNRLMDSYAVVGNRVVRILVGARQTTGTYTLQIRNLSALGLPSSGNMAVRTRQFNWSGKFGRQDSPQDLGT